MKNFRYSFLFYSFVLLLSCNHPDPGNLPGRQKIISSFGDQLAQDALEDNTGSISAAVISHGKLVWSNAFGYADPRAGIPADTSTIYRVGSITKSFTAFLMLQEVEAGYFSLDDHVEKYLPEVKLLVGYSDSTKITFQQLASHRSGLTREPAFNNSAFGNIDEWEDKIISSLPATYFEDMPGMKYNYSNIGFGILGLAISKAGGIPFIKLTSDKIFSPLGMQNSFFIIPDSIKNKVSVGISGGPFREKDFVTPFNEQSGRGYKVPNGGIYSTPNDMVKFMLVIMGASDKKILKKEYIDLMLTNYNPGDSRNEYGLGISINHDLSEDHFMAAGHGGLVAGYSAYYIFDLKNKNGVVMMRNYEWGLTNLELRSKILLRDLARVE